MAIDPNVVFGLKTDPVIDTEGIFNKAAQYRNLISETAYRDQERQTNQQKMVREQQQNAEADRKAQGDQLEGQLIAKNTTTSQDGSVVTNHDAVRQGLAQAGHGDRAATYLTRVQIPAEKELLDSQTKRLDNGKKQIEQIGGILQSLTQIPDDQLPQAFDQNVQEAEQKGLMKPGSIPPAATILQQGGPQALRQFVTQHAQSAIAAKDQIEIHQTDAEFAQKLVDFKQKVADEAPKTTKAWTDTLSQLFGESDDPNKWAGAQKTAVQLGAPLSLVSQFGEFAPDAAEKARKLGMTAAESATAANQAATLTETKLRDAQTAKYQTGELANKQAEIAMKQKEFQAENGGDAVKGWVSTIKDNPDAVSEVPAKLRSAVQQEFSKQTNLPLPKALTGQTKTQETAARNGLAALQQVSEDIKDPEVQKRLGPIMGRFGQAEQDVGATAGLSPQAAEKAQRLRSNMRMMALQEGKSVFGGRIIGSVLKDFLNSSPNTKMDGPTLTGALEGMQDAGMRSLDAADQERFGGKMRSREDRGVKAVDFSSGGPKKIASKAEYDALAKGAQYIDSDGKTYTKK